LLVSAHVGVGVGARALSVGALLPPPAAAVLIETHALIPPRPRDATATNNIHHEKPTTQNKHANETNKTKQTKQAKQFESVGMDRSSSEAMTAFMTQQIILDRSRLAEKFVNKIELEKVRPHCLS